MATRAMEIRLTAAGVKELTGNLSRLAAQTRRVSRLQEQLKAATPRLPSVSRIDRVTSAYEKQIKALERVDALYQSIAQHAGTMAKLPQIKAPRVSGGGGGRGGSGGGSRGSDGFMQGPYQRLERVREQMERAREAGNDTALKDLRILEFRAKRSIELGEKRLAQGDAALKAPGLLDLFQELNDLMRHLRTGNAAGAVKTLALGIQQLTDDRPGGLNVVQKLGRNGIGGAPAASAFDPNRRGAFSLAEIRAGHAAMRASQIGSAATGSGSAGGGGASALMSRGLSMAVKLVKHPLTWLAAAIIGAGLALHSMTRAAKEARGAFSEWSAARVTTGGNTGELARISAYGMDPSQSRNAARALRDRLASDPMAMGAAARLGLPTVLPRGFQDMDEAKLLRQTLERIAGLPTQRQRRMEAQRLDLDEHLPMIERMRRFGPQMRKDAEALERVMKANAEAYTQLNRAMDRNKMATDALKAAWGGLFADIHGWWLDQIANVKFGLADAINSRFGTNPAKNDALDENTRALRDATAALKEGTYGGGPRARGAIPSKWSGYAFEQGVAGETLRLGAFAL